MATWWEGRSSRESGTGFCVSIRSHDVSLILPIKGDRRDLPPSTGPR